MWLTFSIAQASELPEWARFAYALRADPKVERVELRPRVGCAADPDASVMTLVRSGRTTTCAMRRDGAVECRALASCEGWEDRRAVPAPASPIVAEWATYRDLWVEPLAAGLGFDGHLALRDTNGWAVTRGAVEGTVAQVLDASAALGAPGWAVVSTSRFACPDGGMIGGDPAMFTSVSRSLTLFSVADGWIDSLAEVDLGFEAGKRSWGSHTLIERGADGVPRLTQSRAYATSGVMLVPRVATGEIVLEVGTDDGVDSALAEAVRATAGAWVMRGGVLVRE